MKTVSIRHFSHSLYFVLSLAITLAAVSAQAQQTDLNSGLTPHQLVDSPSSGTVDSGAELDLQKPLYQLAQAASNKAQAAQIAKSRHGGKVLSVRKAGNGWKVKLLLDSGRVKMVYIDGAQTK